MSNTRKPKSGRPNKDNPEWTAEDMAKARPARDVLPELMGEDAWQKLLSYGQERASRLGLREADVERVIAEYRRETRKRDRQR